MHLLTRWHDEDTAKAINTQTMFFTQAIILAVKCAWAARAFIVERCPAIWGVDTSCIIDRITDLFLCSKRDVMVTTHRQINTRAKMLSNTFLLSFQSHVLVPILLKFLQMAKRPSREARDQEGEDQNRARGRRRGNADDEITTSSTREGNRDDSDQRQATRRSSRHRGAEGNTDRRGEDPPQGSRDASRSLICSPEAPRRHRSESRIASVRPRPSSSRDHIAVEEAHLTKIR